MDEKDYVKSFQVIFMKPSKIINYCYEKKRLNFVVDPTRNG